MSLKLEDILLPPVGTVIAHRLPVAVDLPHHVEKGLHRIVWVALNLTRATGVVPHLIAGNPGPQGLSECRCVDDGVIKRIR